MPNREIVTKLQEALGSKPEFEFMTEKRHFYEAETILLNANQYERFKKGNLGFPNKSTAVREYKDAHTRYEADRAAIQDSGESNGTDGRPTTDIQRTEQVDVGP